MADNTIDRLEIQVQTQAQKANTDLDRLIGKLEKMSSSLSHLNTGGLKNLANGFDTLSRSVQNMSAVKTGDFTRLAKNIEKLGNINQAGINNTASALRQISSALTAASGMSGSAQQLAELANGISRLGYKSVGNAIANLPKLAQSLRQFMQVLSDAPNVSQNLIQMTQAMANLAAQGSKYNSTIKSISSATNTLTRSHNTAYKSNVKFLASLSKLTVGYYILRRAIRSVFEPISKAMNLGETINLFQTSFKKIGMEAAEENGLEWGSSAAEAFALTFVDKAQKFNDKISKALSLDPNIIMNYQAVFAQMANAFGLATESVMNLSQSFTMLGLDIASLFNVDIEEAMVKLRAGLAGETEPLRALGVDITETTLKMIALKYGIKDSIDSMSQAAKTQLRWLAIMEQTEVAFGDMAKTIDSPANQVRILKQQIDNLIRSLGTFFLPTLQKIITYINAVVIVIRRLINTVAEATGYEVPDYKNSDIYKDIAGDIDGIGDSADDATKSVKELKKSLQSFDRLNILSESKTKGINLNIGGYSELDDAISQKTNSYMEKFNRELANMGNKAEEIANKIEPKIRGFIEFMQGLGPLFKGAVVAFTTYKIIDWFINLATNIGSINPTAGVAALFIGAIVAIYDAVKKYNEKLIEEDLDKRFGSIHASLQEIHDIAEKITENDYTAKINVYISEKQKLSDLQNAIETDLATLQKLNWKVSVGLKLTPEEVESYKSTIEKFISDSEAYIEQQHYVTKLAIDAVIRDENFKQEVSQLVDQYFASTSNEMTRLGQQLRSELDKGLADGVLDAKEQEVIANLTKEMSEIVAKVSDAEFKAKLQVKSELGDLDAKSYQQLFDDIKNITTEQAKKIEEASETTLVGINFAYQAKIDEAKTEEEKKRIQAEWENATNEVIKNLNQTKQEITFEGITFVTDKLIEKYSTELTEKVGPVLQKSVKDTYEGAMQLGFQEVDTEAPYSKPIDLLCRNMAQYWEKEIIDTIPEATRKGAAIMYKSLEPTQEQYKKIFDDALAAGEKVPSGISQGLTDIAKIKAINGDMDAINFLLGQKLSTDPEFLKALATSKDAGKKLDTYLIAGLKSKIPDLKLSGSELVGNIDGAIKKAAKNSADNNITGYVGGMIVAAKNAFEKDTTTKKAVEGWLEGISNTVKTFKLPTMEVNIGMNTSALEAFYRGTQAAGITVQAKASGGYVNTGEMFVARENGIPEMVGRIGNRTAVANNDQITQSIAVAVENSMMNVLAPFFAKLTGNNNSGDISINIDGKEVFRAVRNQSKQYYNMTGKSPFPA